MNTAEVDMGHSLNLDTVLWHGVYSFIMLSKTQIKYFLNEKTKTKHKYIQLYVIQ